MKTIYMLLNLLNPAIAEDTTQQYLLNQPIILSREDFPSQVLERAFPNRYDYRNFSLRNTIYNLPLHETSNLELSYTLDSFTSTLFTEFSFRDLTINPGLMIETPVLSNIYLNLGIINNKNYPQYFTGIKIKF